MRLRGPDGYVCVLTHRVGHPLGRVAGPYSRQSAVRSRRQQMTTQPTVTNAWWMPSWISHRIHRRRNRCSSAILLPRPSGTRPGRSRARCRAGLGAGGDLEAAGLVPVDLVVMDAVGVQVPGAAQWPAARTADRRDGLAQRDQLGDVVAVAAGGDCRERDAVRFDDQVLLAAGRVPAHRGRTGDRPALHRTDVAGVDRRAGEVRQSAARCSESSSSCRCCQTPASFQCRSRRQQVIPEPKPSSWGRNSQRIPLYGTTRIPHSTCHYADAYDLDAADYVGRPAAAAGCAPTTRRRSPNQAMNMPFHSAPVLSGSFLSAPGELMSVDSCRV